VVGVWKGDVFGMPIRDMFPAGEDEDGGAGCVRGCGVSASDCVSYGAAHAFVVVFCVGYFSVVPGVRCVAAT
jgi:hypothetical protein